MARECFVLRVPEWPEPRIFLSHGELGYEQRLSCVVAFLCIVDNGKHVCRVE
jgi:hypothetical protein